MLSIVQNLFVDLDHTATAAAGEFSRREEMRGRERGKPYSANLFNLFLEAKKFSFWFHLGPVKRGRRGGRKVSRLFL
jgi:hypothetical protein